MKKLNFYAGGQPFRSTDHKVGQDNLLLAIKSILDGITNSTSLLILTGVQVSIHPNLEGQVIVTPGVVFDGAEMCVVNGAEGLGNATDVYLRRTEQNSSLRLFDNGTSKYVFTERYYDVIITSTPLSSDIAIADFTRITTMRQDDYAMQLVHEDTIENGKINIYANELGDVLIKATYKQLSTINTYQLPERVAPNHIVYGSYTCQNTVKPLSINTGGVLTLMGLQLNDEIDVYLSYKMNLPR
ncbi:MAG: hypothetical protein ACOXZ9_10690 [Bacteroidales bacterium]|jgi:hypothetical protein